MKRWMGLFWGIILIAGQAKARPEVVFPSEAEVSNTAVISVFQVAEMKNLSGVAFSEIAKMPLVESVEEQESVLLSGEEVSKKLRELVKRSEVLKKINPSFLIPSEIRIQIRKDGVSKAEVERSVKNLTSERCHPCTVKVQVNSVPAVKGFSWNIDWDQEIKSGSFMIPVRESRGFSNKWITGTLRVFKNVPVARKLIRFNERIQAEDIEVFEADITYLKEDAPESSQVVGLLANRTLAPKTPVLLSDLKREPAARRGQIVKALVGDQEFEVSIQASVEENGFIGDVIKIKNPETQKSMSAIVVDKGVVKVQ